MAYIIEYAKISPAVLEILVYQKVPAVCYWVDIDEDYFEFFIMCDECDRASVERILAPYV